VKNIIIVGLILVCGMWGNFAHGMEGDPISSASKPPIYKAVEDLDIPAIAQLLDGGANPDEVCNEQADIKTPLQSIVANKLATDEQALEIMNLLITHGAKINGAHHPLKWVCSSRRALALIEQGCWINSEAQGEKNIFDAIGRFEVAEFSDLKMADLFHALMVRGALKIPDWSIEEKRGVLVSH